MKWDLPLDPTLFVALRESSAFDELVAQKETIPAEFRDYPGAAGLTPGDWPAVFDLHALHSAAVDDPTHPDPIGLRRLRSPERFIAEHEGLVSEREYEADLVWVGFRAAIAYCAFVDPRIGPAFAAESARQAMPAIVQDPVGYIIRAAMAGVFKMGPIIEIAAGTAGLPIDEFKAAVMERAKAMARDMDYLSEERFLPKVRAAFEDSRCHEGPDGTRPDHFG